MHQVHIKPMQIVLKNILLNAKYCYNHIDKHSTFHDLSSTRFLHKSIEAVQYSTVCISEITSFSHTQAVTTV